MNVKIWRGLAGVLALALVIGVYLAGSWIGLPGVAVGDVIGMPSRSQVFFPKPEQHTKLA